MASWCRAADSPDRYLGYFENEHGEQAIFVYDRARRSGTLSLGDAGWEHSHAVVEGTVAGVALGAVEQAWLAACWKAATGARSPRVAVAYLRASKDEQRLSREAQRNAIEAWAMHEGVRVAAWCIDHGVRSVSPMAERPALRAALVALRQDNAGVFVVAKRNRIARDVVLAASITGAVALEGARVVSVSGEGKTLRPTRSSAP